MQFNPKIMYMHMKSKQIKGSIITLLIFEFWKIGMPIYISYLIRKTRNVSGIHRRIPCRYRTHLDKWGNQISTSNSETFWQWSHHRKFWKLDSSKLESPGERYIGYLMSDCSSPSTIKFETLSCWNILPWKVIMSLYYVGSCLQSYVKE